MKNILITGAAKGIGREVVRQLASAGHRIFLTARNEAAGEKAAQEIGHPLARFIPLDIVDDASVRAAVAAVEKEVPQLDVLINNAAVVLESDSSVLTDDLALIRETYEINTLGALRVTRAFRPLLEKSDAPRIVNVSSGAGQLADGADGWAPSYCMSKTALNAVTVQLACALPRFAVNSVTPGWVRTDMGGAQAPLSVEQGADAIVWLATEAPQLLTAKFIRERREMPW